MPKRLHRWLLGFVISGALMACSLSGLIPGAAPGLIEEASQPTPTAILLPVETPGTPTPSADKLLAAGIDAANSGSWDAAIDLFDQVIRLEGDNAQAYLRRGNAFLELDDLSQAIADYNEAISLNPNLPTAHNNRGLAYQKAGNPARALLDFSSAIELQGNYALAFRNRAEVQIIQGSYDAAIADFEVYLGLVPDAPDREQLEARMAELRGDVQVEADASGALFADDFSNPNSGWDSNGDSKALSQYDSGGYRIVATQDNSMVWAMPGQLFTDVRIEVTAETQGGDDDNFFGLMCRVQGTTKSASFYAFLISSDGFYGIVKRVDGGELGLIEQGKMQFNSAINQGKAQNRIAAECSDERLALYVNGQKLVEVTDGDLNTGQVGVAAGTFSIPGTNIFFDDLVVYPLEPDSETDG